MGLFQRLAAAIRNQSVSVDGSSAVSTQALWQSTSRIGGNLTPAQVSGIILTADGGDCNRLVNLAHDSRQKDCHLHATLSTRENALATLPLSVIPYKERGERDATDADADVASFCEEALDGAAGDGHEYRSTDDLIPHLNGGVYHGHATAETGWRRDGRWLLPEGFRLIDQRRFGFRSFDGRLVFTDSPAGVYGGVDLMTDYPGQYLQHQPRVNGDIPSREGLSHLLVWTALFRNWDQSDWMKLAEMAWKPWRIGKFLKKAGDRDRTRLMYTLERLTNNGIATHGPEVEIDLKWPGQEGSGSRGSTHEALANWLGAEMSKAILGQTLTTEQGERGARSLGEVHDRVRKDIRDQDAKAVASTIRRDLIRPLVLLNFGNVPIPTVAFQTDDAPDLAEYAKGVKTLKDAGLRIPANHIHDVTGIPAPQDDEEVLGEGDEDEVDVDMSELEDGDDGEPSEEEGDDEE